MAPDTDVLPPAPAPSANARERALAAALARFDAAHDEKDPAAGQAFSGLPRRKERRSLLGGPLMLRTRPLLAAALVAAVGLPAAWTILRERGTRPRHPRRPLRRPPRGSRSSSPTPRACRRRHPLPASRTPRHPSHRCRLPRRPLSSHGARESDASLCSPDGAGSMQRWPLMSDAEAPRPATDLLPAPAEPVGRDRFPQVQPSGFQAVAQAPVSTFSIDVDTASYAFVRASLNRNVLPPPNAVRVEEMINYFPYAYPAPTSPEEPFRITTAVFPSPWAEGRKLVQVGIKGYAVAPETRPAANLVFLIDTSGSMAGPNRLPLVKQALGLLLTKLDARDKVSIVAYAGAAGTVLPPTPASERQRILAAIEGLRGRRRHRGRRGPAAGLCAGRAGLRGEGRQPGGARHRRRLQPRHHGPGRADGLHRPQARDRHLPVGARLRHGQPQRRADAGARPDRQRRGGVHRHPERGPQGAGGGSDLDPGADRQGREDPGRVQPRDDRRVPADRLRDPGAPPRRLHQRRGRCRRGRLGPDRDGALRGGAGGRSADDARPALRCQTRRAGGGIPRLCPCGDPLQAAGRGDEPADRGGRRSRQEAKTLAEAPQEARFAAAVAAFGEILRGGTQTGAFRYAEAARLAAGARGDDPFGYRAEFVGLVRAAESAAALAPAPR